MYSCLPCIRYWMKLATTQDITHHSVRGGCRLSLKWNVYSAVKRLSLGRGRTVKSEWRHCVTHRYGSSSVWRWNDWRFIQTYTQRAWTASDGGPPILNMDSKNTFCLSKNYTTFQPYLPRQLREAYISVNTYLAQFTVKYRTVTIWRVSHVSGEQCLVLTLTCDRNTTDSSACLASQ
jgi:hypothetical protein